MSSVQQLREFIKERLTAAAEEILTEFEKAIIRYKEETEHQRRLFNSSWTPKIKLHRIDFPQQPDGEKEEVLAGQQLWNQKGNCILDHEKPEPPRVKEERDEFCTSQEGKLLIVKIEADPFMVTPVYEENNHNEVRPNSEQLLSHSSAVTEIKDEYGSWQPRKRRHSNSSDDSLMIRTRCEDETEASLLHDCKEKEVLTVQQLCYQKGNSTLDQEKQDAAEVKEKEEKQCELKQKTDTFLVTSDYERINYSKTEPTNDQLNYDKYFKAASQDQGGSNNVNHGSSKHKELQKTPRNGSHGNYVNNVLISENQSTSTGEKSLNAAINEIASKNESQMKNSQIIHAMVNKAPICYICGLKLNHRGDFLIHLRTHTGEKPYSCEICGKSFAQNNNLTVHMRTHTGERPYSCEICGKSFTRRHNLIYHMRSHTGEKPYSCDICRKNFIQVQNLNDHMRTHIGEAQ
ncbi:uncharacterized protein KZ484_018466 [Pholidichthys leucotaenia]